MGSTGILTNNLTLLLKFSNPHVLQLGGKSRFICELVKYREELFETKFDRIILAQHENLSYRNNETFESIRSSFPRAELG